MTDRPETPQEPAELGSDAQLTDGQLAMIDARMDLRLALVMEEERRTQAAPGDGPG